MYRQLWQNLCEQSQRSAIFAILAGFALAWPHSGYSASKDTTSALPSPSRNDATIIHRELLACRISSPPVIDGDLSDWAWQQAGKSDRFTDALNGRPVPDQTEVYLAYDDDSIYIAFHCHDSQPLGIVAHESKRGSRFQGEDTVAFAIDPFHTHEAVGRSLFIVNPLGTQSAHLGGGRGVKLEWEGKWQSAARIVPDGWAVEIAIPWAILNYPKVKGRTICSINFDRYQQRTNTHSWWSNLGVPERDELDGRWMGVRFPLFRPKVSFLPYVSPEGDQRSGEALHSGLDVRGALMPSLTLVGTINPDFRNVEETIEGIDFTYGERSLPDRRPFFQEGADVYDIGSAVGDFFYSRRIGAFDTGVNLYGKLTPGTTIGALVALDLGHRVDWVLRAGHKFGPRSSLDLALLNRDDVHKENRVLVLAWGGSKGLWGVSTSWAGSWLGGDPSGCTASATLSYATRRWQVGILPHFISRGFHNELGFIPFTDFRALRSIMVYRNVWHRGPLRNAFALVNTNDGHHFDGQIFRRQRSINAGLQTRSDYSLSVAWEGGRFEEFDDRVFRLNLQAHASDPYHNFGVSYAWGRQAGAPYSFLTPRATWRFGQKLTLGLVSSLLSHKQKAYQHIFTFNYDFSPKQGIAARVAAENGDANAYLAYRRSGYGGAETFLIVGDPNARKFRRRLTLKVVWSM